MANDKLFQQIRNTVRYVAENPNESVARGFAYGFAASTDTSQDVYRILRTLCVFGVGDIVNEIFNACWTNPKHSAITDEKEFLNKLYHIFKALNKDDILPAASLLKKKDAKNYAAYAKRDADKFTEEEQDEYDDALKKDAQKKKDELLKTLKKHIHRFSRNNGLGNGRIVNVSTPLADLAPHSFTAADKPRKYEVADSDEEAAKYRHKEHQEDAKYKRRRKILIFALSLAVTLTVAFGEAIVAVFLGGGLTPLAPIIFLAAFSINCLLFLPAANTTFRQLFMQSRVLDKDKKNHTKWVLNLFVHEGTEVSLLTRRLIQMAVALAVGAGFVYLSLSWVSGMGVLGIAALVNPIAICTGLALMTLFQVSMAGQIKSYKPAKKSLYSRIVQAFAYDEEHPYRSIAKITYRVLVIGFLAPALTALAFVVSGGIFTSMLPTVFVAWGASTMVAGIFGISLSALALIPDTIFNGQAIIGFFQDLPGKLGSYARAALSVLDPRNLVRVLITSGNAVKHIGLALFSPLSRVTKKRTSGTYLNISTSNNTPKAEQLSDTYSLMMAFSQLCSTIAAIPNGIAQAGAGHQKGPMQWARTILPAVLRGLTSVAFFARSVTANVNAATKRWLESLKGLFSHSNDAQEFSSEEKSEFNSSSTRTLEALRTRVARRSNELPALTNGELVSMKYLKACVREQEAGAATAMQPM